MKTEKIELDKLSLELEIRLNSINYPKQTSIENTIKLDAGILPIATSYIPHSKTKERIIARFKL